MSLSISVRSSASPPSRRHTQNKHQHRRDDGGDVAEGEKGEGSHAASRSDEI